MKIKPLIWIGEGEEFFAESYFGQYYISYDESVESMYPGEKMFWYFSLWDNNNPKDIIIYEDAKEYLTLDDAKQAAQIHYKQKANKLIQKFVPYVIKPICPKCSYELTLVWHEKEKFGYYSCSNNCIKENDTVATKI